MSLAYGRGVVGYKTGATRKPRNHLTHMIAISLTALSWAVNFLSKKAKKMKTTRHLIFLIFGLFCIPAQANYNTTCQGIGNSVYCNTYDYGAPSNYGANWGNSFLSGLNTGMQARKNAIETQNALLQQQILLQQAQQMARQQQPKISSCKIDKIVGKEFPVGRVELVLTRVASDKYQIVGTDAYVLTKDCFRYMEKQPVIADINYSPSDRIYFE